MSAKSPRLEIQVPTEDASRPSWKRVSIIAVVGFLVGIAWPRLAGIKLGPSAPSNEPSAAASASAGAVPSGVLSSMPLPAALPTGAPSASAATAAVIAPQITIARGVLLSCRTADGESAKGKECGELNGLDKLAETRIRRLATCPGAESESGRLSVVLTLDFKGGRANADVGKSSTVKGTEALGTCLKQHFLAFDLASIAHQHPRYTVSFQTTFTPAPGGAPASAPASAAAPDAPPPPVSGPGASADGPPDTAPAPAPAASGETLSIEWDVALIRETPRTGTIVARLRKGAKVKVAGTQDGWYHIRFGDDFGTDGWVYRGAIGR
jgi:hypothetical protein